MKTCQELRNAIGPFVEGDLAPADAEIVAEHIEECADCQAIERDYRALAELLSPAPHAPSRDEDPAWRRFDAELAERLHHEDTRRHGLRIPVPLAAAAAILLLFTGGLSLRSIRKNSQLVEDNARLAEALIQIQSQRNVLGLDSTRRIIPVQRVNNVLRPMAASESTDGEPQAGDTARDPFQPKGLKLSDAETLATVSFTPQPVTTPATARRAKKKPVEIRLINYEGVTEPGLY